MHDAVHLDRTVDQSVDDHTVKLGNNKLHIVNKDQRKQSEEEGGKVSQIVAIDIFTEKQRITPIQKNILKIL